MGSLCACDVQLAHDEARERLRMLQERSARVVLCYVCYSKAYQCACDAQLAHDDARELLRMLQERTATGALAHTPILIRLCLRRAAGA